MAAAAGSGVALRPPLPGSGVALRPPLPLRLRVQQGRPSRTAAAAGSGVGAQVTRTAATTGSQPHSRQLAAQWALGSPLPLLLRAQLGERAAQPPPLAAKKLRWWYDNFAIKKHAFPGILGQI